MKIAIIGKSLPGKIYHDCSKLLPDFVNTECDPGPGTNYSQRAIDVIMARRESEDRKLLSKNYMRQIDDDATPNDKPIMNRKQRRNILKTKRAGMMRGNNFTPAKKKRK